MSYNFDTTNKKFYFARDADLVYFSQSGFLLKLKPIRDVDLSEKPIVSFVVSRKVGNSVERNLLKRRLRMIFNSLAVEKLQKGFAYILILKKGVTDITFENLKNDMTGAVAWCMLQKKFVLYSERQKDLIHQRPACSAKVSML